MTEREKIDFLVSSPNRVAVLRAVADGVPRPSDLADRCGVSRATVQRSLSGFVDYGWLCRGDDGYRPTPAGRAVLESYETLCDSVGRASEVGELLATLGTAATGLTPGLLEAAEVVTASNTDPHAPVQRFVEVIAATDPDRFRGFVPVASPLLAEAHDHLEAADSPSEVVVDGAVAETLRTNYPETIERLRADGSVSLLVAPETIERLRGDGSVSLLVAPGPIEYGGAVVDDVAVVGAHGPTGRLDAVAIAEDSAVVAWAEERVDTRARAATPLDASVTTT